VDPVDALLDEFKRLASRRDVGAGLQRVVGRIPVLLGIDRAVIYRYNAADKRLVVTHETSGATPSLLGSMHPLAQLPAFMINALETGMQVAVEDFDRYPITESQRRALRFSNVRASVIVPLVSERKPAGLLVVDVYANARTWDANVQTALAKIARVIGAGISGSKRGLHISEGDPTLEIRGAQLNMLSNLAKTLADHRGADAIIASVSMQLAAVYGAGSAQVSIRAKSDRTVAESLETRETLVRDRGEGTRIVVPMIVDGDGVGALDISLQSATLSADDAQSLEAVANMVGSAVITAERYERLRYEAITDGLTELYNHRFAMEQYTALFAQARSSKNPLSVMMIDVDKMRDINNAYGHLVGDSVLRYVARELKASVESHAQHGCRGSNDARAPAHRANRRQHAGRRSCVHDFDRNRRDADARLASRPAPRDRRQSTLRRKIRRSQSAPRRQPEHQRRMGAARARGVLCRAYLQAVLHRPACNRKGGRTRRRIWRPQHRHGARARASR